MMSSMIPYLHFTRGDALWFRTIEPSSVGAVAGACIFLVFLAVFERFYAGWSARIKMRWAARYVDACACLVFLIVPKLMGSLVLQYSSNHESAHHPTTSRNILIRDEGELVEHSGTKSTNPVLSADNPTIHHKTRRSPGATLYRPFNIGICTHACCDVSQPTVSRSFQSQYRCVLWSLARIVSDLIVSQPFRTFSASYIISVLVGLCIGEVAFGRWAHDSAVAL